MNRLHGLYAEHNILPTNEEIIEYVRESPYFVTMLHDDLIPLVAKDDELKSHLIRENDLDPQLLFLLQKGLCQPQDVYTILNKRYVAYGHKVVLRELKTVICNYSDEEISIVFKDFGKWLPENLVTFIEIIGLIDYTALLMRVCKIGDNFDTILKSPNLETLFINQQVNTNFYEKYLDKIVEHIVLNEKDKIYSLNGISKNMWQMDIDNYLNLLNHDNKDIRWYTAYYFIGWNTHKNEVHKLLKWIDTNHHDFYNELVSNINYNEHLNSYKNTREIDGLITLKIARDAILSGNMKYSDLDDTNESKIKVKLANDIDFVKQNKIDTTELLYYVKKDNFIVKNFIIDKLFADDDIYSWEFERIVIKDYYINPYASERLKLFLSDVKNLEIAHKLYAVYSGRYETLKVLFDANPKVINHLDTKSIYFKHMQFNNPSKVEENRIIYDKEQ